ncbi:armadillo-type protein [Melampsora americana]|nr:armadillo-type protein [Melampsora americana]
MAGLDEQLHQAVLAALTPGPHQSQGLQFLQQVRENPTEAWQAGLMAFLAGGPSQDGSSNWAYKYPGETRLFGLQLVDAMLHLTMSSEQQDSSGAQECCQTIRNQLWDYIIREFVEGAGEDGLGYLRNKLVQTLFLIFLQSYTTTWPNFLTSFAALLRRHPTGTANISSDPPALNPRTTDLYLRLLHEISIEISDSVLRLNKPYERLAKDTVLRDAVRDRDAAGIAKETFGIVAEALQGLSEQQTTRVGLKGKMAVDCLEMGIRVVEDYVSWIDISLIVTPTWIPFLYQSLRLPQINIRLAAGDALICTVTKGMPAVNRLQLFDWLGLTDVLVGLQTERQQKHTQETDYDEEEEQFGTKLAKILNGMGVELCKVCDDNSNALEVRSAALQMASSLFPLLWMFFEEKAPGIRLAVIPFASSLLNRYKKDKKTAPDSHMSPEKRSFLSQLLRLVILTMQYPPDDDLEWHAPVPAGETEDEDTAVFLDRRKQMKVLADSIASVDESTFQEITQALIVNVLEKVSGEGSQGQAPSWQEAELCLYMLYNYGEALKGCNPAGPWTYFTIPVEETKKANKNREHKINYSQYPLTSLGMMLLKTAQSHITQFPHPSIPLQWFECVVRYHDFFEICPNVISDILPAFLDERGVHHPTHSIRSRCSYLFYRFLFLEKPAFQNHIPVQTSQLILDKLQDLVVIDAQVPKDLTSSGAANSSDILSKAVLLPSTFDSQLYLFEAIGVLLSSFCRDPQAQTMGLERIISPLTNGMLVTPPIVPVQLADFTKALNVHHCIMAVGAIAKGFPDLPVHSSPRPDAPTLQWPILFKNATDGIIRATKAANEIRIIRDAARSSFHKIVATIGIEALSHVPVFIDCLMDKLTITEFVDFLPFIGQLIHRYKTEFGTLLDSLLIPLVSKIVDFLGRPSNGTDDIITQSELRRAYFTLINSIINANMHTIFLSERNLCHLESILQTIIQQVASEEALPPDLRLGFGVLHRMASTWLKPCQSTEPAPVPGFERFLYDHVIPLCFALPKKPKFDWSDAESYLIMSEIATLVHVLFNIRGDEFVEFLTGSFLPSIACQPTKSQALIAGLKENATGKPTRKPLMEFFDRPFNKA